MKLKSRNITAAHYFFLISVLFYQPAISSTQLMSQPAISAEHIAFIYADDLWVANRDGSQPRRITVDQGIEALPVFSPDGRKIAFNAQYDGNNDVYIVSVQGGVPQRLTWHPYSDTVVDFNADGSEVLFSSRRFSHTNRYSQLHSISASGGPSRELPIPTAFYAAYSDDDNFIAYTPNRAVFRQWKNYRGGTQSKIWIYNKNTHEVEEISKPNSGGNDSNPQWSGDYVYFRSDRNGEFNLFSYNTKDKAIKQLTDFKDYPVMDLKVYQDTIIFEQAGLLHTFDISTGQKSTINVNISADLPELRERYVSGKEYVRSAAISPSGSRVVLDFRGEVVTVPVDKGDFDNLTESPGAHENQPKWSDNGRYVAYFSNASGEYELHIKDLKNNKIKIIQLNGAGFYTNIHWSPDSQKVSYVDNGRSLFVTDVSSGETKKIASDEFYIPGAFRELFGSWSHDSKWISYTQISANNFENAYLYSLETNKSFVLTDGLSNVSNPIFDPSGKYLYLLASTDAGPLQNWFDQSSIDMNSTRSIYLMTLQQDVVSPFKRQNDQQEIIEEKDSSTDKDKKKKSKKKDKKKSDVKNLRVDWSGLDQRVIDLPLKPAEYNNLRIAKSGELYYVKPDHNGQSTVYSYSLDMKEEKALLAADSFELSNNHKILLYSHKGSWGTADIEKDPKKGTALKLDSLQVKIVPQQEWQNIFNEAWQVNRDYFYDSNMHGANWNAMKEKYQRFLPHLTNKSDLYRVMQWMFSELAVGHHRFNSRGDSMNKPTEVKGGLLGADYEVKNDRYRFKKIYGGLNWNPGLRSPLTEPGVAVNQGDYLIAINGKNISATDNLFQYFENTADQVTTLTISDGASGKNSRTVEVTPVASEYALRNRDWVEGNIKKVDAATGGQVAYVYVPNTANAGHEYFKRYFFPQVDKKAIIIDERFNGGGYLADYVIDLLERPVDAYWNFRYGNDLKTPSASIQGPKVMLIDENAGSGGDYLPYLFRRNDLGTLVGKTTWGGLVGVLGYPQFIDGGSVSAPNLAFFNEDGFGIENVGVAPDVEVEQWPKDVINGKDPQLDKAIEIIQNELKTWQPKVINRPGHPDRHNLFRN